MGSDQDHRERGFRLGDIRDARMKDAKGHGSDARGSHSGKIAALPKFVGIGYHGTASKFDQFEPKAPFNKLTGKSDQQGIYFSGDKYQASSYASMAAKRLGGDVPRSVISAEITLRNPLDITPLIKNGQRRGLSFGDAKRAAMTKLTPEHDGVIFHGNSMNPPEYIAFKNEQVRRLG
jgi:hypothetical protein